MKSNAKSKMNRLDLLKKLDSHLHKLFKTNIQCPYIPLEKRSLNEIVNTPMFRDIFIRMKPIGQPGKYGLIFKACVSKFLFTKAKNDLDKCMPKRELFSKCKTTCNKPLEIAIKIQTFTKKENKTVQLFIDKKVKWVEPWDDFFYNKSSLLREIRAMKLMSMLIKFGVCPNVPLLYSVFVCDVCNEKDFVLKSVRGKGGCKKSRRKRRKSQRKAVKRKFGEDTFLSISTMHSSHESLNDPDVPDKCAIIVNELSDGDLKEWMRIRRNDNEYVSAIFQIYMGLLSIQLNYGMVHYDFHWGNVLYTEEQRADNLYYKVNNLFGKEEGFFECPSYGFLFKLWDFGMVGSEVGLGSTFEIFSRQRTTDNKYLNDCVHILYAYFDWSLKEKNKVKRPSKKVQQWASDSVKFIDDMDESLNHKKEDTPQLLIRVIQHMFAKKTLEGYGLDPIITKMSKGQCGGKRVWKVRRDPRIRKYVFGA